MLATWALDKNAEAQNMVRVYNLFCGMPIGTITFFNNLDDDLRIAGFVIFAKPAWHKDVAECS